MNQLTVAMNALDQSAPIILLMLFIGGFAHTVYKVGKLEQKVERGKERFEKEMRKERDDCDRKIERLTQQIIDILRGHNLPTITIESGRDSTVDVDGVGNSGGNRNRMVDTRRGL